MTARPSTRPASRLALRRAALLAAAALALLATTACGSREAGTPPAPPADDAMRHVVLDAPVAEGAPSHDAMPHADAGHDAGQDAATDGHATTGHDAHPQALPSDAPLPGASLYHLDAAWTDHRGQPLRLADLRGHPVLVTMIYASCETACPILVRDVARVYEALPDDVRDETRVLVVSFDPERDAPERLARYVEDNGLEHPAWRFAVGSPHATRSLAALLGVRYRPAGDGMFSHSNLITVLGPDGTVLERAEGLGLPVEPAVEAIVAATNGEALP